MTTSDTTLDDLAIPYIQHLVDQLKEKGSIVSPSIEAAFRHIPRHPFIDHYYMQNRAGPTMKWNLVTLDQIEQADQWLTKVYTDDALITLMSERNQPTSSSSAPCAMADMLESLALCPGMRVLEIGTGTGYNAAILAYLTGDPHLVFTVDLYPALTDKARARLDRVAGPGITVHTGNGLDGYAQAAPYDRIIATASWYRVPLPWLDQLRPNGIMVMNLRGRLGWCGFLRVVKTGSRRAACGIFTGGSEFMVLQEQETPSASFISLITKYTGRPVTEHFPVTRQDFDLQQLSHNPFLLVLQLTFPYLYQGWIKAETDIAPAMCLIDTISETLLKFCPTADSDAWTLEIRGDPRVWEGITKVWREWQSLNDPPLTDFAVEIDEKGQQFMLLPRVEDVRWIV
jgi:protein-L-isoaspartate(D-aspartate) O-methyltransferase